MKALKDLIDKVPALALATYNSSQNGTTIDTDCYGSNAIFIDPGTITDGTHVPSLQDSPDGATWTAVAAGFIVGTFSNLASNVKQKVSYIGGQRYVRLVVTVTPGATGGSYGASCVLGDKRKMP